MEEMRAPIFDTIVLFFLFPPGVQMRSKQIEIDSLDAFSSYSLYTCLQSFLTLCSLSPPIHTGAASTST